MDPKVNISRRSSVFNPNTSSILQIEHKNVIHHITDNKIDDNVQIDPDIDDKIRQVIGNSSMKDKDGRLSKLIVNELKPGTEIIGDKGTPIISNITFAPENDTLVAMAYIAGNLLNKLWHMEKEASSESIETEVLKHEKISDLVELFREPLSLRQEKFLKNALEQLSKTINKNDREQITICENLNLKAVVTQKNQYEDDNINKSNCDESKKSEKTEKVSQEAFDKVKNVLRLINKFEEIQTNLSKITDHSINKNAKNIAINSESDVLTEEENISLNTFRSVLEKITRLLMPNKMRKRMADKIKHQNIFSRTNDFKKKLKLLFNIDLSNITTSTKDKLIMDYLTHIEKNPDCLFNKKSHRHVSQSIPQFDGDILLKLSEFLKIKSYSDLVNLLDKNKRPEQSTKAVFRASEDDSFIEKPNELIKDRQPTDGSGQLEFAKETLKEHLKMVLEDIVTLQNFTNNINTTDVKISDIVPCIYNLLNAEKKQPTRRMSKSLKNIKVVFDYLKNEIQLSPTRRSNGDRKMAKSAVVWERVIKNLNKNTKSRRNLEGDTPKTFGEIKEIIYGIESLGSNTYKNVALLSKVPYSDRLALLQTLQADVRKYQKVFEDLKRSIKFNPEVPREYLKDFNEFIDNVAMHIKLNEKVIKSLKKEKSRNDVVDNIDSRTNIFTTNSNLLKVSKLPRKNLGTEFKDNIRLTRDQIINHLIKNRIKQYLNAKETNDGYISDIKYAIAKKILVYLERGNDDLARDLFKIFAKDNHDDSKRAIGKF